MGPFRETVRPESSSLAPRAHDEPPRTTRAPRPDIHGRGSRGCSRSGALLAVLAAALATAAGCMDAGEPVASASSPIIWGDPTTQDQAVVALLDKDGQPYCTGTVISPRLVLTAAHCIIKGQAEPTSVFFGFHVPTYGASLPAHAAVVNPDYDPATLLGDVALVELAEPSVVPYVRVSTVPMSQEWIGYPARMVGFGYTGPEDDALLGVKYHAFEAIDEVDGARFRYGEATCQGDSGGPAFVSFDDEEVLVGVTSSGPPDCRDYGRSIRVDVYADWIGAEMWRVDPTFCEGSGTCPGAPADPASCAPDEVCPPPAGCTVAAGRSSGPGAALVVLLAWLLLRTGAQRHTRYGYSVAHRSAPT